MTSCPTPSCTSLCCRCAIKTMRRCHSPDVLLLEQTWLCHLELLWCGCRVVLQSGQPHLKASWWVTENVCHRTEQTPYVCINVRRGLSFWLFSFHLSLQVCMFFSFYFGQRIRLRLPPPPPLTQITCVFPWMMLCWCGWRCDGAKACLMPTEDFKSPYVFKGPI